MNEFPSAEKMRQEAMKNSLGDLLSLIEKTIRETSSSGLTEVYLNFFPFSEKCAYRAIDFLTTYGYMVKKQDELLCIKWA